MKVSLAKTLKSTIKIEPASISQTARGHLGHKGCSLKRKSFKATRQCHKPYIKSFLKSRFSKDFSIHLNIKSTELLE